jgi:hypothetical protein
MLDAPIVCEVQWIHDADTLHCKGGPSARIAAVEANELGGGCHLPRCPRMDARTARNVLARIIGARIDEARSIRRHSDVRRERLVLANRVVLHGYVLQPGKRPVVNFWLPDGRSLSCAIIARDAAVVWPEYWTRYGMGRCS